MKQKLLLYVNPHTPPSRQRFSPEIMNPPGKRGAPKGHKGAIRALDNPDKIICVTAETCPWTTWERRRGWHGIIPPEPHHTMLKCNLRGVIRRIQEFLIVNNNLDLSIKDINDAFLCVGEACRSEWEDTVQDQEIEMVAHWWRAREAFWLLTNVSLVLFIHPICKSTCFNESWFRWIIISWKHHYWHHSASIEIWHVIW